MSHRLHVSHRLHLAALCIAATLPPAPASAQATLRLDGTCERLVAAGRDLTGSCAASLTNAVSRGRTTFAFATADGRTVSFSGNGAPQEATEETDPLQPINAVTEGADGVPRLAVGACRFSTPERGRTAIACEARTADGVDFSGTFVTAARPDPAPPAR